MSFIDPAFAGQVPFERLVDEANNGWTALSYLPPGGSDPVADTPAVVSLDKPTSQLGSGPSRSTAMGGPRYSQGGTVFLPRGIDRKRGDRFTHNGVKYSLIGAARGDQDHPVTGDDFGWVTWSFEGSG
ncbi:hypothetical protein BH11ACT6_BH11ACT6_34900 [soil metagenome]